MVLIKARLCKEKADNTLYKLLVSCCKSQTKSSNESFPFSTYLQYSECSYDIKVKAFIYFSIKLSFLFLYFLIVSEKSRLRNLSINVDLHSINKYFYYYSGSLFQFFQSIFCLNLEFFHL